MRAPTARDRPRGMRGLRECGQHDLVRIGKAGFLACQCTHADTLLDAVRAVFHDAIFERPRFIAAQLKIQVRIIDAVTHDTAEDRGKARFIQA